MSKKIFHTIWYGVSESESYNKAYESIKSIYNLNKLLIKKHDLFYSSNYHIEIDMVYFSHDAIYDWLEDFASTSHVNCTTKLIIIRHFDLLEIQIQQAFRMLMEDRSVRLYITALWIDKIDDAIQSRCVCIKVPYLKSLETPELLKIASLPNTRSNINKWLTHCHSQLYLRNRMKSYKASPENLNELFEMMVYCPAEHEGFFIQNLP